MTQGTARTALFKEQLRDLLIRERSAYHNIKVATHAHIYTCGDNDSKIYFIERGQIKLVMTSPDGKECLLSIHTPGDIFGELSLVGLGERQETAIAIELTKMKGTKWQTNSVTHIYP